MNILFLSHYYPPEGNAPATRTFENTRRWVAKGHSVTVITCAPNVPHGRVYDGYRNALFQKETIANVIVWRVWTYIAANKGKGRRSLNYFSFLISSLIAGLFVKKPDLIIATTPQFFCGCAGAIISRIRNIPFVLEVRDIWPDSIIAVNAVSNPTTLKWMYTLERWLYRSATHMVTVGKGYAEVLQTKGVSPRKVSIIPNGANLEQFNAAEHPARQDKTFVCSFIGTIGMAAKLDIVIRAAKHLDAIGETSIRFQLVGDGAELDTLKKAANAEGLSSIQFTGLVDKEKVVHYLSTSDACLVHLKKSPLFKTVLPSKMFEAMASGIPILIGVEGTSADLVKTAHCGLVFEPENHLDLCEKLLHLKQHPSHAMEMGHSGRKHVEAFYNRDQLATDYMHVLSEIASGANQSNRF